MDSRPKLSWGLIGCGDIARKRIAPAFRDLDNCQLVAVSRANFAAAESFAREFDARHWHQDWRDLVTNLEVDAVYIATPVHLHAEQTIAAAEAGKHVLCEKPMALNVGACDRMIAAAEANGVKLGVAYYRHFYPVLEFIISTIASGAIGRPVFAQINAFEWFDPEPANPRRWLLDKIQAGGGPMFDFGCHRVEVLLNLFGPVSECQGLISSAQFGREVEDTASALFQFESGVQCVLSVTHAAREPQDTLTIFGTGGTIRVPILNDGVVTVLTADGERTEVHPPHPNFHQPLIDDFALAVIEQRKPVVDGMTGRETAAVVERIYRSATSSSKTGDRNAASGN